MYYQRENICYKGEWYCNMAHGYGEEYDSNQNLVYKGLWSYNNKID